MRVLIIDDDAAYLSACSTILSGDGHQVVACANFDEGRRRLAQDTFDALIADVRLGAYNGLHLVTLAAPSMIKIAAGYPWAGAWPTRRIGNRSSARVRAPNSVAE